MGQQYSYNCTIGTGMAVDKGNGRWDFTLSVSWNGESINGVLAESNNYGDHVYRFYLHFGVHHLSPVTRNTYISVSSKYIHNVIMIIDFVDIIVSTSYCSLFFSY